MIRLKNSVAQDIVYAVSNGTIQTPKSVLFPTVVKSLCNNTEVLKIVSQYGHGISYDKVEEIETEYASKIFCFVLILHLISGKVTKFPVEKLSTSEVIRKNLIIVKIQ